MPVGDALRMCFPPLLFISLIYLYISPRAQPLAEEGRPGLFLFIYSPSSRGFPVGVVRLAMRAINLAKIWMS